MAITKSRESVWAYPRPPRAESCSKRLVIHFGGEVIADTSASFRVLETSHPPVYYLPLEHIRAGALQPAARVSYCEWKGHAEYYDVVAGGKRERNAAWTYPRPTPAFRRLIGHVAFSWILNGVIVTLAILNVSPFRMPKLGGGWYYAIFVYVVAMTLMNMRALAS